MDSAITTVLELLGDWMKHLKINAGARGGGVGVWMPKIDALEDKWEIKMNEVADQIYGMDVFTGGRRFKS